MLSRVLQPFRNRSAAVLRAAAENKHTAYLYAVLCFPGGDVGDRTPDL